jgi:hypothetical protein
MTRDAQWTDCATDYFDLTDETKASARCDVTISQADDGIIMEQGAGVHGLVLYAYNGSVYFQCGDGSASGDDADTAEIEWAIPATDSYTLEWSADTARCTAALYVDGSLVSTSQFSTSKLAGDDNGGICESHSSAPENRAGWTSGGNGAFSGTIDRCDIFLDQVTQDVQDGICPESQ